MKQKVTDKEIRSAVATIQKANKEYQETSDGNVYVKCYKGEQEFFKCPECGGVGNDHAFHERVCPAQQKGYTPNNW